MKILQTRPDRRLKDADAPVRLPSSGRPLSLPAASATTAARTPSYHWPSQKVREGGVLQGVGSSPGSANRTGLPDGLKVAAELHSGMSMDDVRVRFRSSEPEAVGALAFAQGTTIHVAPGAEAHLAHELAHVAQQKRGDVGPTGRLDGRDINDDPGLERSAEQAAVLFARTEVAGRPGPASTGATAATAGRGATGNVIQRVVPRIRQPRSNLCWATVGWAIDRHYAGSRYGTLRDFVYGQAGDPRTRRKFDNNRVADIDEVIGSGSRTNRLRLADNGPFALRYVLARLRNRKPIIANVNGDHYIVITGASATGARMTYMDPASGAARTTATTINRGAHITKVGAYTLSMLYYTK